MGCLKLRNAICLLVVLLVPSAIFAAMNPAGARGSVATESSNWNFSHEAARLLTKIHSDAYHAQYKADLLESYDRDGSMISWQTDAVTLSREKHWVNRMNQHLYRLRKIERVLPSDQQAEINAITPAAIEAVDVTQAAILYLNHHEDELFVPHFANLATDLYRETSRIEVGTAANQQQMVVTPGKRSPSSQVQKTTS